MKAPKRRVLFWVAGTLAVANLVAYFVYTLPRSMQKRNVASRLVSLEQELKDDGARVAGLKTRNATILANRKESRSFLEDRVARPATSLVPILEEVESLARAQGLKVGGQGFHRDTVQGLPIEKFEIDMPVSGTYDQVTGLVQDLEQSQYFLTLDEIAARSSADSAVPGVSLTLKFSAYFRTGPEVASR